MKEYGGIYRINPETGDIVEVFRSLRRAAKVAKVTEGQMRQAIERGDELRQSLWEAEDAETYALEFTDGRRIVVKAVEMDPKNVDRLFEKGMDSRPRLKDARVVFPARDLQAEGLL